MNTCTICNETTTPIAQYASQCHNDTIITEVLWCPRCGSVHKTDSFGNVHTSVPEVSKPQENNHDHR